jgi:hypothetical protein
MRQMSGETLLMSQLLYCSGLILNRLLGLPTETQEAPPSLQI